MNARGQMNLDFIISAAVFIAVLIFVLLTIYNTFPPMHKESVYSSLLAKGYDISQMLLNTPGNWAGLSIDDVSVMGMTNGNPYILDPAKAMTINNCNQSSYLRMKSLLSLGSSENFIINISRINFTGGPDEQLSICRPLASSSSAPKFWVMRHAVIDDFSVNKIVRVDVVVY